MDPSNTRRHGSAQGSPAAAHRPGDFERTVQGVGSATASPRPITMAKDAEKTNDRLFPMFLKNLSGDNLNAYRQTADKLAVWLNNDKAYYSRARTTIIELLEAAYETVCRRAGTPGRTFHVSRPTEEQKPWSAAFVKMMQTVLRFSAQFPEPLLRTRLRHLARISGMDTYETMQNSAGNTQSYSACSGGSSPNPVQTKFMAAGQIAPSSVIPGTFASTGLRAGSSPLTQVLSTMGSQAGDPASSPYLPESVALIQELRHNDRTSEGPASHADSMGSLREELSSTPTQTATRHATHSAIVAARATPPAVQIPAMSSPTVTNAIIPYPAVPTPFPPAPAPAVPSSVVSSSPVPPPAAQSPVAPSPAAHFPVAPSPAQSPVLGAASPPLSNTRTPSNTSASASPTQPRTVSGHRIKPKTKKRFSLDYLQVDLDEFDKNSKGGFKVPRTSSQALDATVPAESPVINSPVKTELPLPSDSAVAREVSPSVTASTIPDDASQTASREAAEPVLEATATPTAATSSTHEETSGMAHIEEVAQTEAAAHSTDRGPSPSLITTGPSSEQRPDLPAPSNDPMLRESLASGSPISSDVEMHVEESADPRPAASLDIETCLEESSIPSAAAPPDTELHPGKISDPSAVVHLESTISISAALPSVQGASDADADPAPPYDQARIPDGAVPPETASDNLLPSDNRTASDVAGTTSDTQASMEESSTSTHADPCDPDSYPPISDPDLIVLWFARGSHTSGTMSVNFELTEEEVAGLSKWTRRYDTDSDVSSARCFTLGCYSFASCIELIKGDSTVPQEQISRTVSPAQWPTDGTLSAELEHDEGRKIIRLSPPLQSKSERLVDLSALVRPGPHTLRINESRGHSDLVFMIHHHAPSKSQLNELQRRRLDQQTWQSIVKNFSKIVIPKVDTTRIAGLLPTSVSFA